MDIKQMIKEITEDVSKDFIDETEGESNNYTSLIEQRLDAITDNLNARIEQALGKMSHNNNNSENEQNDESES